MEIPSKAVGGFEHGLLRLVQKIRALGPHIALLVLPAARQQAHAMMWVNRWNRLEAAPFLFQQTCSCSIGGPNCGLHVSIYLARSLGSGGNYAVCDAIPTTGLTGQALLRLLAGIVVDLLPLQWATVSSEGSGALRSRGRGYR